MKKIISILILIYVTILMFYGLIIKVTLSNPILFKLKTVLPELVLLLIITISFMYVIKYKRFKLKDKILFLLLVYLIGLSIINIFTLPSVNGVICTIRDLILPIVTMYSLIQIEFNEKDINYIIKNFINIIVIFIVIGCVLACIQQLKGWEWTSKFYTNYIFYGFDPISKVKVWEGHGLLRTPSVTGNSVTFAFYSLVAYIMVKKHDIKLIKKYILLSMCIISILMSTSKTAIIILITISIIDIINKFKSYSKISILIFLSIITITLAIYMIQKDPGLMYSTFERFKVWSDTFKILNPINLIIPLSLFELNASSEGFLSFLDNTYLYFAYSIGVIGLAIVIRYVIKLISKYKHDNIVLEFLIIFVLASAFLNITQGRSYFSTFCVLIPIVTKSIDINNQYNKEYI